MIQVTGNPWAKVSAACPEDLLAWSGKLSEEWHREFNHRETRVVVVTPGIDEHASAGSEGIAWRDICAACFDGSCG